MLNKTIYFDHAATTPVSKSVVEVMQPYFSEKFGNASSIYAVGREAKAILENARREAGEVLGCTSEEVIFTSGATESNNLIIKGVAFYWLQKLKRKPHIITTSIEHPSVLNTCRWLKENFGVELTELPVSQEGIVSINDVEKLIKDNTAIITIMYGNNEVGSIQPLEEIGKRIKATNEKRKKISLEPIVFHTDAVQAFQFLDVSTADLALDALTLTAHKFYGPKGVGLLYIKKGTKFLPLLAGGSQEFKIRAGTENIPLIVGMVESMREARKQLTVSSKQITELRDYLIDRIVREIPDVILTGPGPHSGRRLPHIASFIFKKIEGESILINLDLAGIAASSGSACTSGSLASSHVLLAMGYGDFLSHGSIRFSLGKQNKKSEIDEMMKILPEIVKKLKKISPIK